jgi:NAD(P)-dependent dehydrogenase (short-subunit alcohol dehydrogenase family)
MKLENRVATITGAGNGMGMAMAKAFAHEGAKVVVSDVNVADAETVAHEIVQAGGQAIPLCVDVAREADAMNLAATAVAHYGRLDIHVNNAGISQTKLFVETSAEEFERICRVNLLGAFMCAKYAVIEMLKHRYGRIINIASLSGQRGGIGRVAYGASKAGLELMTKVMAVELASSGINVNSIAPGAIATRMATALHDAATREAYHYLIPQRRYGKPEEVADAAVFLASDAASHICGTTLNVDGGFQGAGLMFRHAGLDVPPVPAL